MNETEVTKNLIGRELDLAQAQDVAGGDLCSADELVGITSSLIKVYEDLVSFTSHVIGRVAGES